MSQPLRRIDVDPETPIRDVDALLTHPGDAIEIRVGDRLFVIRRLDDEAAETDSALNTPGQDED